ncbi:MAG: aryl-sulfate sulfotransferase [Candidatus Saccharibacteria bacterium]|nr:aryl-sulfate sulfotransferase [Candidatus Saccharibacteria bacterium]
MKKKPVKRIIAIVIMALLIVLIVLTVLWMLFGGNSNTQPVKVTYSLISQQAELEKHFAINGYTVDEPNIIVNPYGDSPLTALVIFRTNTSVAPVVKIKGKDELTTYQHEFELATEHYLPIYGLYPDSDNKVTISYVVNGVVKSHDIIIRTDELPDKVKLPADVYADKSKLTNDLYFYSPSSDDYPVAYDVNGDVRWYSTRQYLWDNSRLANGHMLVSTDRMVNPPYYMTGLYEINLLGKVYAEYSLPGGYHHDYDELPNGNLLVASDDFLGDAGTVEDVIVELDRKTGEVVKTIDLKDILDSELDNNENWLQSDWFHNNSVWYDEATNSVTLSGRHQDAVVNINYDNGQLNWIIGDPTGWPAEYQKYFFTPVGDNFEWQWSQHAAMVTPEGYVFILDNGNNKSKNPDQYVAANDSYSRGVMYKLDIANMTIEQAWQYGRERGSEFYSPYISDVDYLTADHYIVHSGGIVQVDGQSSNQPAGFSDEAVMSSDTVELIDNQIVFELKLPTNMYRVEKMSLYPTDNVFRLGTGEQLGSLGQTPVDEMSETWTATSAQGIDDDYRSHEIKLTQEYDRLTLSGRFKKGQHVRLILRQGRQNLIYDVNVSKKPYTALCVDVWSDDENEHGIVVNKYINNVGLSGKYNIYLSIDDKVYNTGEYVNFPKSTAKLVINNDNEVSSSSVAVADIRKASKVSDITFDDDKVNMYVFWGDGCAHCEDLYETLAEIWPDYGQYLNLYSFEIWNSSDNMKIADYFRSQFGRELGSESTPYYVIGNQDFVGYRPSQAKELKQIIKSEYHNRKQVRDFSAVKNIR